MAWAQDLVAITPDIDLLHLCHNYKIIEAQTKHYKILTDRSLLPCSRHTGIVQNVTDLPTKASHWWLR